MGAPKQSTGSKLRDGQAPSLGAARPPGIVGLAPWNTGSFATVWGLSRGAGETVRQLGACRARTPTLRAVRCRPPLRPREVIPAGLSSTIDALQQLCGTACGLTRVEPRPRPSRSNGPVRGS